MIHRKSKGNSMTGTWTENIEINQTIWEELSRRKQTLEKLDKLDKLVELLTSMTRGKSVKENGSMEKLDKLDKLVARCKEISDLIKPKDVVEISYTMKQTREIEWEIKNDFEKGSNQHITNKSWSEVFRPDPSMVKSLSILIDVAEESELHIFEIVPNDQG